MRQKSQLVLPCDPEYTAHREAAKHREETRDWLRERERIVRERTLDAWGRTRAYSHEGRFRA